MKPTKGLTNNQRAGSEPLCGTDVSILVTEPSPEAPTPMETAPPTNEQASTVVQVLVHRESEEYNQEEEEELGGICPSAVVVVEGDEEVTLTVKPPEGNGRVNKHQDS